MNETVEIATVASAALAQLDTPAREFLKATVGSPASELGALLSDEIRLRRFNRQLKIIKRAQEMSDAAGFEPSAVSTKLLAPLIDSASLEDDSTMQDKWSALLARAANDESEVPPVFVQILSTMSGNEARFLDRAYDLLGHLGHQRNAHGPAGCSGLQIAADVDLDEESAFLAFNSLKRGAVMEDAGTIAPGFDAADPDQSKNKYPSALSAVSITWLGIRFVEACRAPTIVSDD